MPLQLDDEDEKRLLFRCAAIDISAWSDALNNFGFDGVVDDIPQRSGCGRIAGFAVTARQVSGDLNDYDRSDFKVASLVDAARPGKIVMVTSGGAKASSFGGIASLAASMQGASGLVIDGSCRDIDEIRATGLWLASRHVTPRTGKNRLHLIEMHKPVQIGGVTVDDGDLIVADGSGIVVVPRIRLKEILKEARNILSVDEAVEREVQNGRAFNKAAAEANYLPLTSSY